MTVLRQHCAVCGAQLQRLDHSGGWWPMAQQLAAQQGITGGLSEVHAALVVHVAIVHDELDALPRPALVDAEAAAALIAERK